MQTSVHVRRRLCASLRFTLIAAWLSANAIRGQTPPHVQVDRLPGQRVQITVTGEAQRFHRIDGSTNLTSWRPLVVLTNITGTAPYEDTNASALPMRFYRAAQIDPVAGLTGLGQQRGSAGAQVEIFGQFFDGQPGDNVVRIGDVIARVIEASGTRLLIELPIYASTGPLTVTTPSGETSVRQFFVVTAPMLGTFEPPSGVNAAQYELVNPYGAATPVEPGNPTNQFLVRRGRPIVNMAVPTNRADETYFLAVTISDGAPFVIDAASTAQALVFMNPFLQTRDAEVAAPLLAIIAADAKVQLLASNIAAIYPLGGDPFANASFVDAYTDAVASVINSSASKALTAKRAKAASEPAPGDVDLDFIVLTRKGNDVFVDGRALNPVDWGLTLSRLKTDTAFPKGERDYRRALLFDKGLTNYTDATVVQRFDIEADLAFERFDVIDAALDELKELVAPKEGQKLDLAQNDSIYLLRAIGPAWTPANEFDFAQQHFQNEYVRIVAINLLNAVLDLLSVMVDAEELGGELAVEIADAALREAAGIQSTEDFLGAAAELAQEVAKKLAEKGAEAAAEKVAGKALMEKIAGSVGGVFLKVLEIISAPGQIIERVTGLARTSTMETTFIVTGNPFKLDIVSVNPPGGAVGESLEIVIRGAQLDKNDPQDFVGFSTYGFPGKILSTDPVSATDQKIIVQIPQELKTYDDGVLPIQVIAQGRRGYTNFNLVRVPVVTEMEPASGFAAAADYLGTPFGGTTVRLKGYGFVPTNTFLFGGVEATVKSGTFGDVTLQVPAGASSGSIVVRRIDSDGMVREGLSPSFHVFGPPAVTAYAPSVGYAGSGIRVTASNLGAGPATLRFIDGTGLGQTVHAGNQLAGVMPFGTTVGPVQLRVITPAGQSAPIDFTILDGPAPGGFVQVGGLFDDKSPPIMSPITLARAAALVGTTNAILGAPDCSSGEFCVDDQDVIRDESGNIIEQLDPPVGPAYEEGDFMTDDGTNAVPRFPIGAAYADGVGIVGTVAGGVTFTGSHDTISGGPTTNAIINGPLTIAGSHNHVLYLTIKGTLTISGDNNEVNVVVGGASGPGVVITGHHNTVTVLTTNNSGDGLIIDGGSFNLVNAFSLALGNGGNGFTVMGGAVGNILAVGTALPGVPPGSGNAGHGVAVLDANRTVVVGTGLPIGGNVGNGIHIAGHADDTKVEIVIADSNGGHGIYVGPGISGTVIYPAVTSRNGQHGIYLDGCSATRLLGIQTGFNSGDGIRVSGVNDADTVIEFAAQANTGSALRLNSTSRLRCNGVNSLGSVGLELNGANATQNSISMSIDRCTADGARLFASQNNELSLAISKCSGHGLFVSGGGNNTITLTASNNTLDGAHFTDGAQGNGLTAIVLSNRTGVVLAGGAKGNRLQDLRANANREHGLLITGAGTSHNRVLDARVGLPILTNEPPGNSLDGIRIDDGASDNTLGADSGHGPEVRNNGDSGIRVSGGTNNVILGALVALGDATHIQPAGIVVENSAMDTIIGGFAPAERCTNSGNLVGIHIRSGAARTVVQNCLVQANGGAGVLIENAPNNLIGSTRGGVVDHILNNFGAGIELNGAGTTNCHVFGNDISGNNDGVFVRNGANGNRIDSSNDIHANTTGVRVDGSSRMTISGNSIHDNAGSGVICVAGASDNHIIGNSITQNGVGVTVDGGTSIRNEITGNIITANVGKGISLLAFANEGIEAPLITSITSQSVMGTNSAPEGSTVDVFSDLDDEGEKPLGSGTVHNGRFTVALNQPLKITDVGVHFNLHATVTDKNHNTSEFGDYVAGGNADGGAQIAFTSTRDGNAEIYLTDGSSLPPTRLTTDPADDHSPALSPDGAMLAFVSTRTGNQEIFTLPLSNTTSVVQLTTDSAADYDPAWSADGSNVVFVSERDGNAEIYRMNADGSGLTRLTFDAGTDRWPTFSPNGSNIVFTSTRNGNFDLFVMDGNGSNVVSLAAHSAADTRPSWSPDGELIAFTSERDGNLELYTVKPDGTSLTRLTTDAASDSEPSWFPNGQTLVFSSNRDEGYELYTIPRAGGPAVRLTVSTGDNLHPSAARR